MNKKALIYSLSMAIPALAILFVSHFAFGFAWSLAIVWAIVGALAGFLISSIIYDSLNKIMSVKVVSSKIYVGCATIAMAELALTSSWVLATVCVAIVTLCLIQWLGFRFIFEEDRSFEDLKLDEMEAKMIYKDKEGKDPLCLVEGVAITPKEARRKGFIVQADAAREYLRTLL